MKKVYLFLSRAGRFFSISLLMLPVLTGSGRADEVPSEVITAQEMVVTATRTEQDPMDIPFNVTVVTRKELLQTGASTLEQALRTVPGLQIGVQGNAYPHIEVRGFRDTKDLAILINGIPFRQLNGSADLTMIPMGIIERIEFVKGPSSSIWGRGAVAGTLNIITRPEDREKVQATLQIKGGSFGTYGADARVVIPHDKGYVMVNAGGKSVDGYQDDTGKDSQNALLTADHRFSDTFDLGLQCLFSNVNSDRGSTIPIVDGEPAYGVEAEDNFGIDGAGYDGRYAAITLSPSLKFGKNIRIQDEFSVTRFDRLATGGITVVASESNKGWWVSDSEQTGFHNDFNVTMKHATDTFDSTLLVGSYVEIADQEQFNPSYSWSSMPKYGPPDWETPLTNTDNPPTGIKGSSTPKSDWDQEIVSFYIQESMDFGRFSLMAGVRYDRFEEELTLSTTDVVAEQSDSQWSPRFAINWRLYRGDAGDVSFFSNYAEGFRTQLPKLSTKNGETLPQILAPEETESYEAGFKFSVLNRRLYGQISVFETKKLGPRSFRTSTDDFLFTNARSKVNGVESEIKFQLSDMITLWGHYTYHDAGYEEFTDSSGNSFEGNRVRMSPRHIAGAGFNLSSGIWNWNVSTNYVGDRNLRDNTTGNLQNLDGYVTVNSAVTLSVGKYDIQLVGNNLFDEYYIADDFSSKDAGFPGEPRSVYVCLRSNF